MNNFLISCLESRVESPGNLYGKFFIGPFPLGQGTTVATALRRSLLSELHGIAIVAVEIRGAEHEYSALPGVRESVLDIILNLKQIAFAGVLMEEKTCIGFLQFQGPGEAKACHIKFPNGIFVVNGNSHVATLSYDGTLSLKVVLSKGKNSMSHDPSTIETLQGLDFLSSIGRFKVDEMLRRKATQGAKAANAKSPFLSNKLWNVRAGLEYSTCPPSSPLEDQASSMPSLFGQGLEGSPLASLKDRVGTPSNPLKGYQGVKGIQGATPDGDIPGPANPPTLQVSTSKEWLSSTHYRKIAQAIAENSLDIEGEKKRVDGVQKLPVPLTSLEVISQGVRRPPVPTLGGKANEGVRWPPPAIEGIENQTSYPVSDEKSLFSESPLQDVADFSLKKPNAENNLPKSEEKAESSTFASLKHISEKTEATVSEKKRKFYARAILKILSKISLEGSVSKGSPTIDKAAAIAWLLQQGKILFSTVAVKEDKKENSLKGNRRVLPKLTSLPKRRIGAAFSKNKTRDSLPLSKKRCILPVDALFMPIVKANFLVETDTSTIQENDYIFFELWTNGSIHPRQALFESASTLMSLFSNFRQADPWLYAKTAPPFAFSKKNFPKAFTGNKIFTQEKDGTSPVNDPFIGISPSSQPSNSNSNPVKMVGWPPVQSVPPSPSQGIQEANEPLGISLDQSLPSDGLEKTNWKSGAKLEELTSNGFLKVNQTPFHKREPLFDSLEKVSYPLDFPSFENNTSPNGLGISSETGEDGGRKDTPTHSKSVNSLPNLIQLTPGIALLDIANLNLPLPLFVKLKNLGIDTVEEILQYSANDYIALYQFEKRDIILLESCLNDLGTSFY
jgi:DNA-directed RNA polymerase alpha subunit|uniref:Plastid-encoded RNA polymerase subunit alpha n=1 Tax=Botryococcus braunii Showa TaxID=1202541 RepID=A0A161KRZ7_BOTBR|nr:alpha subunit of RNA polymerase (chloroplast) [Botryococcus braunii Showa]